VNQLSRRKIDFVSVSEVFSPEFLGPITLGLWQGRASWWQVCGYAKQLTSWWSRKQRDAWNIEHLPKEAASSK
jgi:hypothetical protein